MKVFLYLCTTKHFVLWTLTLSKNYCEYQVPLNIEISSTWIYLYVCLGPRKAKEVDRKYLISLSDKLSCLIPSRCRRDADTDQPQVLYCYVLCLLLTVYWNISSFSYNHRDAIYNLLLADCRKYTAITWPVLSIDFAS